MDPHSLNSGSTPEGIAGDTEPIDEQMWNHDISEEPLPIQQATVLPPLDSFASPAFTDSSLGMTPEDNKRAIEHIESLLPVGGDDSATERLPTVVLTQPTEMEVDSGPIHHDAPLTTDDRTSADRPLDRLYMAKEIVNSEQLKGEESVPPRSIRSPALLDPTRPKATRIIASTSSAPASLAARERLIYGPRYSAAENIGSISGNFDDAELSPYSKMHSGPVDARQEKNFDDALQAKKDLKALPMKRKRDSKDRNGEPLRGKKSSKKSGRPKIPSRPVSEITSPKEIDFANRLLKGKAELTEVLSEHECRVLGERFWIFTVEQLEYVLPGSNVENGEEMDPQTRLNADKFRVDLAMSSLALNSKDTSVSEPSLQAENTGMTSLKSTASIKAPTSVPVSEVYGVETHATRSADEVSNGAGTSSQFSATNPVNTITGEHPASVASFSFPRRVDDTDTTNTTPATVAGALPEEPLVDNDISQPLSARKPQIATTDPGEQHVGDVDRGETLVTKEATPSDNQLSRAGILVDKWRSQLTDWLKSSQPTINLADGNLHRFSFGGPIGVLLPEHIRHFLKSVSINTLFEFYAVRKTESSPFIAAFYIWRRHCGLSDLKLFSLTRYIAGLSARLETGLCSVPPASNDTRNWMGGAFAVLSGASKDFLIDECGCTDPKAFVDSQTTSWSPRLVAWRKRKGMSELKGSGKVAMISGWKTAVRESLELEKEKGKVVVESELMNAAREDSDMYGVDAEETPEALPPSASRSVPSVETDARLVSQEFLAQTLKPENVAFLASVGIHNAKQLIDCGKSHTSPFMQALVKFRSEQRNEPAPVQSCSRLAYEWIGKLRKKAEESIPVNEKIDAASTSTRMNRKPTIPRKKRIDSSIFDQDPVFALSVIARQFLGAQGINTAEAFLSTRTTDLARDLIVWRSNMNMPELKGGGESATISGWKASVRKRASQVGQESVAAILPSDQPAMTLPPRVAREPAQPPSSAVFPKIVKETVSHPGVLYGLSQRQFGVRKHSDRLVTFFFELSVRTSTLNPSGKALFLCYLGSSRAMQMDPASEVLPNLKTSLAFRDGDCTRPVPVLEDTPMESPSTTREDFESFSSDHPGSGLIDIGLYGAKPFPAEDYFDNLVQRIRAFVLEPDSFRKATDCEVASTPMSTCSERWRHLDVKNRGISTSPGWGMSQCLLQVLEPLEVGQAVEIEFDQTSTETNEDILNMNWSSVTNRVSLARSIQMLSRYDLNRVIPVVSSLSAELGLKMLEQGQAAETQLKEKLESTVSRRRMHWVGTKLLAQIHKLRNIDHSEEKESQLEEIRRLLIVPELSRHFASVSGNFEGASARSVLKAEVSTQIKTDIALHDPNSPVLSSSCEALLSVLEKCSDLASDFVLTAADSTAARQKLNEDLCAIVAAYAQVITNKAATERMRCFASEYVPSSGSLPPAIENGHNTLWDFIDCLPPGLCAHIASVEAYKDTMELVDEPDFAEPIETTLAQNLLVEGGVVRVRFPWSPSRVISRSLQDATAAGLDLHEEWYIENHALAIVSGVAASSQTISGAFDTDVDGTLYRKSYFEVCEFAKAKLLSCDDDTERSEHRSPNYPGVFMHATSAAVRGHPSSLPLFLALVWPRLRSTYGWRIKSGGDPDDVSFLPPQHKRQRGRQARREESRKRAKIERRVMDVGLGNVTKLEKRLFVVSAKDSVTPSKKQGSVADAIKQFTVEILASKSTGDIASSQERLDSIARALQTCFEELKGTLSYVHDDSVSQIQVPGDVESDGPAYLMRMLMVVPSVLRQAGLPMSHVDETVGVLNELSRYLADNYEDFFDQNDHMCREVYKPQPKQPPFIACRLQSIAFASESLDTSVGQGAEVTDAVPSDNVRELVLPQDLPDLTEFASTVLRQSAACRATMDDILRKERKHVTVGYPGIMCRHCARHGQEGRYFFANAGSLGTASGVLFDHLMRCNHVSASLKTTIEALKKKHSSDLKKIRFGAQAEYFKRLWNRLFSANANIESSDILLLPPDSQTRASVQDELDIVSRISMAGSADNKLPTEFKSHIELSKYLQTESPWKDKKDLQSCFALYYKCMKYGGQLYGSSAMPEHFSSEWLLDKLVPHRLTLKRTFNVG